MKIKFELELDTNDDTEIGSELLDLVGLFKTKLEEFNDADDYDEEEYEEVVEDKPKPRRSYSKKWK